MFDPAPNILIFFSPLISLKKKDNSFIFFGLNRTEAGPPRLNQDNFERFSLKEIFQDIFFLYFLSVLLSSF